MTRQVPHDLDAERSCLGAMMLDASVVPDVRAMLGPGDFYKPNHGAIFAAICALYEAGEATEPVVVADRLRATGELDKAGGTPALAEIQSSTPVVTAVMSYASIVARMAHRRRLAGVLADAVEASYDFAVDPDALAEGVCAKVLATAGPSLGLPVDANSFDDWLTEEHVASPWAIPGLLRIDWRCILVAAEGTGKSVCARAMALMAAQGIHPFTFRDIPAINTLLVDLENPDEAIAETGASITERLKQSKGALYREHGCWLWHRPEGIDVRSRADRAALDAVISHVKPRLVCLGPLYRAFSKRGREDHEEAAEGVQRAFDALRRRHGFALVVEHHAPKGFGGKRDLVPFGSSLWQRWPDLGITLERDADVPGALRLGRYRGDRVKSRWPERLDRGIGYPWSGYYPGGIDAPEGEW